MFFFTGSVHKILPMRAQCETIAKPGMRLVPVCSFQIDREFDVGIALGDECQIRIPVLMARQLDFVPDPFCEAQKMREKVQLENFGHDFCIR